MNNGMNLKRENHNVKTLAASPVGLGEIKYIKMGSFDFQCELSEGKSQQSIMHVPILEITKSCIFQKIMLSVLKF